MGSRWNVGYICVAKGKRMNYDCYICKKELLDEYSISINHVRASKDPRLPPESIMSKINFHTRCFQETAGDEYVQILNVQPSPTTLKDLTLQEVYDSMKRAKESDIIFEIHQAPKKKKLKNLITVFGAAMIFLWLVAIWAGGHYVGV